MAFRDSHGSRGSFWLPTPSLRELRFFRSEVSFDSLSVSDLLVIAPTSGHRPYHGGAVIAPTMVAPNGPIGYRPRHYHGAWTWHFQTPGLQCRAI